MEAQDPCAAHGGVGSGVGVDGSAGSERGAELSTARSWFLEPARSSHGSLAAAATVPSSLLSAPLPPANSPLLLSLLIRSGRWWVAISVLLQSVCDGFTGSDILELCKQAAFILSGRF